MNPDQKFIEIALSSSSIREALIKLGIKGKGGNYDIFKRKAKSLGLELSYIKNRISQAQNRNKVSNQDIIETAKTVKSRQSLLRNLGLKIDSGSNVRWIEQKITSLKIDTSHWTGQAHNKGRHEPGKHINLEDVFQGKKKVTSHRLRLALITQNMLPNKCASCELTIWQGKPISLHLDHIDGNHENNTLENLRLLCPNCHSQTPTYCRRKSALST